MNQCRADYCLKFETKSTQPIYIVNRENPQDSEPQNGSRRGLDFIAMPGDKLSLLRTAKSAEQNTIEFPTVSKRRASHLFATKAGKPA